MIIQFEKDRSKNWAWKWPCYHTNLYINGKEICVISYNKNTVIWAYYHSKTGKMGIPKTAVRKKKNDILGFYVKNIFVKTE